MNKRDGIVLKKLLQETGEIAKMVHGISTLIMSYPQPHFLFHDKGQ